MISILNCLQIDYYGQEAAGDKSKDLYYYNEKGQKVKASGHKQVFPFNPNVSERTEQNKCIYKKKIN